MQSLESKPVSLYIEANPNPNSLKFVANFMLVKEGETYDFPSKVSAASSPIAQQLFDLPYVERVFIMSNFITVTKYAAKEWEEIKLEIRDLIASYLESGQAAIAESGEESSHNQPKGEIEESIVAILDEYIKPAVEMDGGAIQFHSFSEGAVKVMLQGSCSGCPASMVTLKQGIENLLKAKIPDVKEVIAEEL